MMDDLKRQDEGETMVRQTEGEKMIRPAVQPAPVLRVELRYPVTEGEAAALRVIRDAGVSLALPHGLDTTGLEVTFVLEPSSAAPRAVSWAVKGTRVQRAAVEERIEALMKALRAHGGGR